MKISLPVSDTTAVLAELTIAAFGDTESRRKDTFAYNVYVDQPDSEALKVTISSTYTTRKRTPGKLPKKKDPETGEVYTAYTTVISEDRETYKPFLATTETIEPYEPEDRKKFEKKIMAAYAGNIDHVSEQIFEYPQVTVIIRSISSKISMATMEYILVFPDTPVSRGTAEVYETIARFYGGLTIASKDALATFMKTAPTTRRSGKEEIQKSIVRPMETFNPEESLRWMGLKMDGMYTILFVYGIPGGYEVYRYQFGQQVLLKISQGVSRSSVPATVLAAEHMTSPLYGEYYYVHSMLGSRSRRHMRVVTKSFPEKRLALKDFLDTFAEEDVDFVDDYPVSYVPPNAKRGGAISMSPAVYRLGDLALHKRPFQLVEAEYATECIETMMAVSAKLNKFAVDAILAGSSDDAGPSERNPALIEGETDGIILTPYEGYSEKVKPADKTTIDLVYIGNEWKMSMGASLEVLNIPADIEPYLQPMERHGIVCEMAIIPHPDAKKFDAMRKSRRKRKSGYAQKLWRWKMVFVRTRPDKHSNGKPHPNSIGTVLSNIAYIRDHVDVGTIFGKDPKRVFRIMRTTMAYVNNNSGSKKFIEIGAGRGGNTYNYPPGSHVLMVEYTDDYYELVERTTTASERSKRAKKKSGSRVTYYTMRAKLYWGDQERDPGQDFKSLVADLRGSRKDAVWKRFFDPAMPNNERPVVNLFHVMTFVHPTEYPAFFQEIRSIIAPSMFNIVDWDLPSVEEVFHDAQVWSGLGITITRPQYADQDWRWQFPANTLVADGGMGYDSGSMPDTDRLTTMVGAGFSVTPKNIRSIPEIIQANNKNRAIPKYSQLSQAEKDFLAMQIVRTFNVNND